MTRAVARLAALLRLACFLGAVQALVVAVALRSAKAHLSEHALDTGARMLEQLGPHRRDPGRTLRLNGAVVRVVSGSTRASLTSVVDAFARRCQDLGPRIDQLLAPLGAAGDALESALPDSVLHATAREVGARRAAAACFDTGSGALSLAELAKRLGNFSANADLATLGDLRFLYTEHRDGRTTYVLLSTAGSVPLLSMFPEAGDAPGRDVPDLPRPPGGRRVLSAWQADARPLLSAYRAGLAPEVARARYRRALEHAGATVIASPDGRDPWLVASRGDHVWLVTIAGDPSSSYLAVTPLD